MNSEETNHGPHMPPFIVHRSAFIVSLQLDHPPLEQVGRQADAAVFDPLGAAGADAGADEPAGRVAVAVDPALLEAEQVVHLDLVAFHAADLADVDNFSLAAGQPASLDDDLQGAGDLRP